MLFACAEALYAHGYSNEACRLAVELARDLLANPPDLKVEQPQTKVTNKLKQTKYIRIHHMYLTKTLYIIIMAVESQFKIVCLVFK